MISVAFVGRGLDVCVKGCLLCITSSLLVTLWQTHQSQLLKEYPERLRLTILQNGFSFLASSVYAAATERHLHPWKLGWNINLLSVAYSVFISIALILGDGLYNFLKTLFFTASAFNKKNHKSDPCCFQGEETPKISSLENSQVQDKRL